MGCMKAPRRILDCDELHAGSLTVDFDAAEAGQQIGRPAMDDRAAIELGDDLNYSVLCEELRGAPLVRYLPRRGFRAVLTKLECTVWRTTIRAADASKAPGLVLTPKRD